MALQPPDKRLVTEEALTIAQAIGDAAFPDKVAVEIGTPGTPARAAAEESFASLGLDEKVLPGQVPFITITEAPYLVSREGALGDGTDEKAKIQAAMTKVAAAKGELLLEAGRTYSVSSPLDPKGCKVLARDSTIRARSGAVAENVVQATDAFIWEGGVIDGNKANTSDPGVTSRGCGVYLYKATPWTKPVVMRDVRILNTHQIGHRLGTGVATTDAELQPATPMLVDNVTVEGAGRQGFYADSVGAVTYRNCRAKGSGADGFWSLLARDISYEGCSAELNQGHGFAPLYAFAPKIIGGSASGNTLSGLALGGGVIANTETRWPVVAGFTSRDNANHGITLDTRKIDSFEILPIHASLSGVICEGNGIHGLYANYSSYISVAGGVFNGNSQAGISYATSHTMTSGIIATGNGTYGVRLNGHVAMPFSHHRLGVNMVEGNTLGGYHVESETYVTDVAWAAMTAVNPTP